MQLKRKIFRVAYHTVMIAFSFIMIYPLIWVIASSLKPTYDIMPTADQIFVSNPTLENYVNGWKGFARYSFATFFGNSIFLSCWRTVAVVFSSSIIAFGFARVRFKGRKFWFVLMLGTMMLPGMVLTVPSYLLFNSWGWVGTFLPLLVPCWFGNAFDVFLIMQFMRNIPREMDEAAEIDGCGWWKLFTRVSLPLIKPALSSVAILSFINAWNDFYGALLYLNKAKFYPVAYALKLFEGELGVNYGPMLAMSVLSLVPILILFFIFQKQLVEGISTSGIKG